MKKLLLTFLLLLPNFAQAQDRTGVTAYAAAWFAASQPATAMDMLALLPGFAPKGGDASVRGFSGAVGNVLIDGALPAGKEDSLETLLQRIPASAVTRIELIRADAGFDMHGYPLLANVVREQNPSLRGRVELEEAGNHYGFTAPRGAVQLTWQGEADTLDLSGSYGREWNGNHGFGTRDRFAPDGTVLRLASYAQPELQITAEASARYRRGFFGGALDLSGLVKQQVEYSDITEQVSFPAAASLTERDTSRLKALEGQLHYQHPLGVDGNWQLFLLHRADQKDGISRSDDAGGTDIAQSRRAMRETVLRGDARTALGDWSLEAGMEGAYNVLRSHNALVSNGVAVALPSASIRVEEQRAEIFAETTWHAAPTLTMELGARQEFSHLGESGDTVAARSLAFFKPRLRLSWRPLANSEIRLLAERRIGQLDFDAFASSASLASGTVSAGNRDLAPERSLRLELGWEQHLWERASITLTLRHDTITGVLDHLAIVTAAGAFDAIGNVGNGQRTELEAALTLPLDKLALPGVTLQFAGTARHSELRDPVTGQERRISGSEPLGGRFDLTQDLPAWQLRWGLGFSLAAQETDYRIDEIDDRHHVSKLGVFVEFRPAPNWTVRLFGQDLAQPAFVRDRLLYDGLRGQVPLDHQERRQLNNGALLGLNLRFDFSR